MSSARIIGGLAMFAGGYAIAYYGANVLMWAHSADEPANDPIPLSHLFGFPSESVGDPGEFKPPFHLGEEIPGSITDSRGLLGGTATTGGYNPPEFTVKTEPGYNELGPSNDDNKTGGGTGVPPIASNLPIPGSSNPTGRSYPQANGPGFIGSGTPVPQGWKPGEGFGTGRGAS